MQWWWSRWWALWFACERHHQPVRQSLILNVGSLWCFVARRAAWIFDVVVELLFCSSIWLMQGFLILVLKQHKQLWWKTNPHLNSVYTLHTGHYMQRVWSTTTMVHFGRIISTATTAIFEHHKPRDTQNWFGLHVRYHHHHHRRHQHRGSASRVPTCALVLHKKNFSTTANTYTHVNVTIPTTKSF